MGQLLGLGIMIAMGYLIAKFILDVIQGKYRG